MISAVSPPSGSEFVRGSNRLYERKSAQPRHRREPARDAGRQAQLSSTAAGGKAVSQQAHHMKNVQEIAVSHGDLRFVSRSSRALLPALCIYGISKTQYFQSLKIGEPSFGDCLEQRFATQRVFVLLDDMFESIQSLQPGKSRSHCRREA